MKPLTRSQIRGALALLAILLIATFSIWLIRKVGSTPELVGLQSSNEEQSKSLLLDLNEADSVDLVKVRGIGKVLSARIVKFRKAKGGYSSVEELQKVYGIDEQRYEEIKEHFFVDVSNEHYAKWRHNNKTWGRDKKIWNTECIPLDLNAADSASLVQLKGIGPILSARIVKFRKLKKGFKSVEEVSEVYGLSEETYQSISPCLYLGPYESDGISDENKVDSVPKTNVPRTLVRLDLNRADSAALEALPGIGEKLSARIVRYRKKLGFYHSVTQLKEVWGLSPENYEKAVAYLFVQDLSTLPRIRVNAIDDYKELAAHPYISYSVAKRIISYRKEHGPYRSMDDFGKLYGIEVSTWKKLEPYLDLSP